MTQNSKKLHHSNSFISNSSSHNMISSPQPTHMFQNFKQHSENYSNIRENQIYFQQQLPIQHSASVENTPHTVRTQQFIKRRVSSEMRPFITQRFSDNNILRYKSNIIRNFESVYDEDDNDDFAFVNSGFPQKSDKNRSVGQFMGCGCNNSKCLKRYCDCFHNQRLCDPNICKCVGCQNKVGFANHIQIAKKLAIQRNPNAFQPKIDNVETIAHRKGCNCKKSGCSKRYCECFQANVPCGQNCKCNSCKNGRQNYDLEKRSQFSRMMSLSTKSTPTTTPSRQYHSSLVPTDFQSFNQFKPPLPKQMKQKSQILFPDQKKQAKEEEKSYQQLCKIYLKRLPHYKSKQVVHKDQKKMIVKRPYSSFFSPEEQQENSDVVVKNLFKFNQLKRIEK